MKSSSNPASSRRRFLQAAGSAPVLAMAAAGTPALASAALDGPLRRSDFVPCVGQLFDFEAPAGGPGVRARLQQVQDLAAGSLQPELSFSLLFAPESGAALTQGTWRFRSAQGPSGLMFLSPNDAQGRELEAVFNRG